MKSEKSYFTDYSTHTEKAFEVSARSSHVLALAHLRVAQAKLLISQSKIDLLTSGKSKEYLDSLIDKHKVM